MNELRQNFLSESIDKLGELRNNLKEDFNEHLRRELFRIVHTVKGGAQTFGLDNAAQLAAELENILADRENFHDENRNFLLEGIQMLSDALQSGELNSSDEFTEKLQNKTRKTAKSEIFLTLIPPKTFKSLAQTEQTAALDALRRKENILCAEVGFASADFASQYRQLRKLLSEKSEIIAALPNAKFNSAGRIGFQIFLASRENAEYLSKLLKRFAPEIVSQTCAENDSHELFQMFSQIALHAEDIAEKSGKEIGITILASDIDLPAEMIKNLFDILLHLVRNAVDHAVEKTGKLEIRLFDEGVNLHLTVADNGKGIDTEKVRARAIEKKLISDEDILDGQQMLELIFASELSTAETLTEISGRGIGLDAVKSLVEKLNGKISVKSRKTFGTTFEIILPKENL